MIRKRVVAALSVVALVAVFFAWCSWFTDPGTWMPESRFMVGFIAVAFGAIAWMAAGNDTP